MNRALVILFESIPIVLFFVAIAAVVMVCHGCVPALPPEAEVVEVKPVIRNRQACERWFAFGDDVPEDIRALARRAAADIKQLSPGIRIAFGEDGKDQFVVERDGSSGTAKLDFLYGTARKRVEEVTTTFNDGSIDGRVRITILPWRVPLAKLWRVITHALGHACGLFDVPEEGNVMTGEEPRNAPPVTSFGPADYREAREKGY